MIGFIASSAGIGNTGILVWKYNLSCCVFLLSYICYQVNIAEHIYKLQLGKCRI